tara:strand:- start:81 stop:377 length:297 start_codon:yes stop_codon:yes gene_type:complete
MAMQAFRKATVLMSIEYKQLVWKTFASMFTDSFSMHNTRNETLTEKMIASFKAANDDWPLCTVHNGEEITRLQGPWPYTYITTSCGEEATIVVQVLLC